MLALDSVALIAICSTRVEETYRAIKHCIKQVNFGQVTIFTDKPDNTQPIDVCTIHPLTTFREYQHFIVKKMPDVVIPQLKKHITHILQINWDGFIVNSDGWRDEFLNYDYIGAPWCNFKTVGNGGFVLKSKKFLYVQKEVKQNFKMNVLPEDIVLSICLRSDFLNYGCKYATMDLAYKFSTEEGRYEDNMSFGFHNLDLHPQFKQYIV